MHLCRLFLQAGFLLGALTGVVGCGSSEASNFNSQVIKTTSTASTKGKEFGALLLKYRKGEMNSDNIETARKALLDELEKLEKGVDKIEPTGEKADVFRNGLKEYLKQLSDIVKTDYPELIKAVGRAPDPSLKSDDINAEIEKRLETIEKKQADALAALKKKQEEFAQANNLKLQ